MSCSGTSSDAEPDAGLNPARGDNPSGLGGLLERPASDPQVDTGAWRLVQSEWSKDGDAMVLRRSLGAASPPGLLDLVPDGIVVADEQGRIVYCNRRLEDLLGWSPQSLAARPVTTLIPQRLRAAHQQAFASFVSGEPERLAGRSLRVAALTADGAEVPVELVVAAWPSAQRRLWLVGAIRDVTEQVDLEHQSDVVDRLLAAVAHGADDLGERFAEIVGQVLEWDVAALWAVEADRELSARGFWRRAGLEIAEFRAESEAWHFEPGVGLPGRTWQSGEPTWVSDLALDDNFPRSVSAAKAGLRSGFAFPLSNRRRIVGIVELYSIEPRQPEPGLLAAMGTIGERLGDLLDREEAHRQRRRLLDDQQRLVRNHDFLLNAARALARTGGYIDTLDRLARVAVPSLADLCLIDVLTDEGGFERMVARHADSSLQHLADELRQYPPDPNGGHPAAEVMSTRRPRFSDQMSGAFLAATTRGSRHLEILRRLRFASYMCLPLVVADRVLGTLTLVSAGSGRRFGAEDLALAEELAGHAGAVLERAQHHDLDRETVRYLQAAFLPTSLPATEGLEMAVACLPASDVAVGGDWYDVFPLEEGSCIAIGDVAGHGLRSVAVMAQLRNALRAFATVDAGPAEILSRLNRMLCRLEPGETATAITATWNPADRTLVWASAGHPPLLRCRLGEFGYLTSSTNPLLGAHPDIVYRAASKLLRPGTTLVMYTDGLIETRARPIDEAMEQLLEFATGLPDLSPQAACDEILNWRLDRGPRQDDICILAVRLA